MTLTDKALVVCGNLRLGYMKCSGEFDPGNRKAPFGEEVRRFLIYVTTDGDDGWVRFAATEDEVLKELKDILSDEWSLEAIYDLEAEEFYKPLLFDLKISIIWKGHHCEKVVAPAG